MGRHKKNEKLTRIRIDIPKWVLYKIKRISVDEGMMPNKLMAMIIEGSVEVWDELGHMDTYLSEVNKDFYGNWKARKPNAE